ncbi:hypothetical protein [Candidatus Tisiphia endosymbiont of Ptychoptera albimana]|uniref:hypothetical protein n=1 Tax=Candidatus Tisiphia endosymbiont of Ptychoptera albimana TaxID=3066260 RepID=UPI00312C8F8E
MNFFNDRELALRFKNNAVSSKERFWYVMIGNILYIVSLLESLLESSLVSSLESSLVSSLESFLFVKNMYLASVIGLPIIIGAIICYNTNKAGDDKEFIERYVCIGTPVLIRTKVLTFALFFFGTLIKGYIFKEIVNNLGIISNAIGSFYFYWRLNSSIRIAAN